MKNIKTYLPIFILLACFSSLKVSAQVTAVMDVKVTIISGASLTQQSELNLFLQSSDVPLTTNENLFELTTAKHTEVNFNLPTSVQITNEFGETTTIFANYNSIENKDLGTHSVALESSIVDTKPIRGKYSGEFTTTIDYL